MDAEFHRSEEIHTVCRRVFNTVCKKTNIMTNLIRRNAVMPASLDVEHLQDPADGVAGQAQAEGGFGPSPAAARSISPNGKTKVKKSNRVLSFFRRAWKAVKAKFRRNRETRDSSQPNPELLDVPNPRDPERITRLQDRLEKCALKWTPVTEVWPNVFIGNVNTARDPARLEEMNITHLLNAAPELENETSKNEWEKVYKDMNITSLRLSADDDGWFDVTRHFFPAADFIHTALSKPQNKVLVCCLQGVSRSATLFLAYLMIHHNKTPEDSIDLVTHKRFIRPSRDFLRKLTILAEQRHLIESDAAKNRSNSAADKPDPEVESVDSEEMYVCEPYGLKPVTKISHIHNPEACSKLDKCALKPDPEPVPGPSGYRPEPKAVDSEEMYVCEPYGLEPVTKISHIHDPEVYSKLDKCALKPYPEPVPGPSGYRPEPKAVDSEEMYVCEPYGLEPVTKISHIHDPEVYSKLDKCALKPDPEPVPGQSGYRPEPKAVDSEEMYVCEPYGLEPVTKISHIHDPEIYSKLDKCALKPDPEPVPGPSGYRPEPKAVDSEEMYVCEPYGLKPVTKISHIHKTEACSKLDKCALKPYPEPVPGPSGYIPEPKAVDSGELCVSDLSGPQPQPQMEEKISLLHLHFTQNISNLDKQQLESRKKWVSICKVFDNLYVGSWKRAMDIVALKRRGITHVLNTLPILANQDTLRRKQAKLYETMNISYHNVFSRDDDPFNFSCHIYRVAELMHKILSNPENQLLVQDQQGSRHACFFVVPYLMIYHGKTLTKAISHMINRKHIRMSRDLLTQLVVFACHHNQQQQPGLMPEFSSVDINHPQIISQMYLRTVKPSQYWTPVSEVWPNVFIADEKTARNKVKLKKMNITHIVNAVPLSLEEEEWKDYYQKKNITYYNVRSGFGVQGWPNIAQFFSPAAEFLHKALSDTKNKVLLYCSEGLNQSVVLFMAYLMIHQRMKLEEAFEFLLERRRMWISRDYLNQLVMLNLDLAKLRKLNECRPCCTACYEAILRLNLT
ncbi:uncharacterized protein isoform X2 [Danio rerio]|uniref:Uncharacterized protein isoform X2 n=1 Tax=Danio rerio TaxID=7955 RepID=A0AC58HIM8_DANRE